MEAMEPTSIHDTWEAVANEISDFELKTACRYVMRHRGLAMTRKVQDVQALICKRTIYFKDPKKKTMRVDTGGFPFVVLGRAYYECEFGRHSRRKSYVEIHHDDHMYTTKKRRPRQRTKKIECGAGIYVRAVAVFKDPGLKIQPGSTRKLQEYLRQQVRSCALEKVEVKFYCNFPSEEHHNGHVMGQAATLVARLDPRVIKQIKIESTNIHNTQEVKDAIGRFICEKLFAGQDPPPRNDHRFWPTMRDVRNHMVASAKIKTIKNFYVCCICEGSYNSLDRAESHYMFTHMPAAQLPLLCSVPECKWRGRTAWGFSRHVISDSHKTKAAKLPNPVATAIPNPCAITIPDDAFKIVPNEPPTGEPMEEVIQHCEDMELQQAVKRLKTAHSPEDSRALCDPEPQSNHSHPTSTLPKTCISQCTPHSLISAPLIRTLKIPPSPLNSSTPILDDSPLILVADLDDTSCDADPDIYEFHKRSEEIMVHFQNTSSQHRAEPQNLVQSFPSNRLRLVNAMDTFYSVLAPYHNPQYHRQRPTSHSPSCPKCQLIEKCLVAAVNTSAPELLDNFQRKDKNGLPGVTLNV